MLENNDARFRAASDQSLLVYFGEQVSPAANQNVLRLLRLLESEPVQGIRNLHPAYCSLLIKFDALKFAHTELETVLRSYLGRLGEVRLPEPRLVQIPVCYGGEFGPDLKNVAAVHGISDQEVIELHSSAAYSVYFLGFVPGFAYLGGLPQQLATARIPAPRAKVPRGSVGIAGNQSGVYPFDMPGGWRLLGRTPLEMFRPDRSEMALLTIGDQVRFVPISPQRFAALESR
jgi:inhibitor of KinA